MARLDQSQVGSAAQPSLTAKPTADITRDAQRVAKAGQATNEFDPAVNVVMADPSVRTYADKARARARGRASSNVLKKSTTQLGHGPPISQEKARQIANLVGGGMAQPNFTEEPEATLPPVPPQSQPPPQGVGASYEVNKAMAEGRTDGPVSMREAKRLEDEAKARAKGHQGGKAPLSPETVQALQMATNNASQEDASAQAEVAEAMREASRAEPSGEGPLDKAERSIVEDRQTDAPDVDDRPLPFDFEGIGGIRNKLMSKSRRETIEARLGSLDISDMIMKREIQQVVPVVPGKLELTFRTMSQKEGLWILQYIFDFPGSTLYTQELLSTCRLVASVIAINGKYLPEHREGVGQSGESVSKEGFKKKMEALSSFPIQFIADMSVQLIWFEDRVNDLFGLDALKNG